MKSYEPIIYAARAITDGSFLRSQNSFGPMLCWVMALPVRNKISAASVCCRGGSFFSIVSDIFRIDPPLLNFCHRAGIILLYGGAQYLPLSIQQYYRRHHTVGTNRGDLPDFHSSHAQAF